jgi:purine-binding chemotaxis protein CheW
MLIVSSGFRTLALPVHQVVETMRPLPIEPIAGVPDFVRGVSVIRGAPVPVVDLAAVLDADADGRPFGRFVTLDLGARRLALGVEAVVGVRELDAARLEALPPLLGGARGEIVEAIGVRDAQLLVVLRAARIIPESLWNVLQVRAEAIG